MHVVFFAGLLVYVAFAVLQCTVLQPEPYYGLYDSDNWARARWFLLKRLGLASGQSKGFTPGADFSIFNSTAISSVPGGPNTWRLPQDTSGQQQYCLCPWSVSLGPTRGTHVPAASSCVYPLLKIELLPTHT